MLETTTVESPDNPGLRLRAPGFTDTLRSYCGGGTTVTNRNVKWDVVLLDAVTMIADVLSGAVELTKNLSVTVAVLFAVRVTMLPGFHDALYPLGRVPVDSVSVPAKLFTLCNMTFVELLEP